MGCGSSKEEERITTESPEFKAAHSKAKRAFALHDGEGDNKLDVSEFAAMIKMPDGHFRDRLMTLFDLDESNEISFQEFCTGTAMFGHQIFKGKSGMGEFCFRLFDIDNNGQVTKAELKAAVAAAVKDEHYGVYAKTSSISEKSAEKVRKGQAAEAAKLKTLELVAKTDETLHMDMIKTPPREKKVKQKDPVAQELMQQITTYIEKNLHEDIVPKTEFLMFCVQFPQLFQPAKLMWEALMPYAEACRTVCEGMGWKPSFAPVKNIVPRGTSPYESDDSDDDSDDGGGAENGTKTPPAKGVLVSGS